MAQTTAKKKNNAAIAEGDRAFDFTLAGDNNSSIRLSSFRGRKNIVLYFYPKDNTPGCTTEAKDFAAAIAQFESLDTVIFGISRDSVESHDKFKEKLGLPFTLLSDADGDVCEEYGVWGEKNMYGRKFMGITRSTFLIDKEGIIHRAWRKVKVSGHVDEVLAAVRELQS